MEVRCLFLDVLFRTFIIDMAIDALNNL